MSKFLRRPMQLALIPPHRGEDWDAIDPPRTHRTASSSNNYRAQWRAYVNAAKEVGWTPTDVAEHGTEALAHALAEQGLRNWSPATVTRYAKLARYAGLDPAKHPPPRSAPVEPTDHRSLWRSTLHPASQRNALSALITWHYPLELPALLDLRTAQLSPTPSGGIALDHAETVTIPTGGAILNAWLQARQAWRPNRWLFCTTHTSRTGSPPGAKLSIRGFQASFAYHAALAGNAGLTWQHYRTLALRTASALDEAGGPDPSVDGPQGRLQRLQQP